MNYNFKVIDMMKQTTSGSLSNVVQQVKYNLHCTGSDNVVYTQAYMTSLDSVKSSDFIAYNSLSESRVNAWVTGSSTWSAHLTAAEAYMSASMTPTETWGIPSW